MTTLEHLRANAMLNLCENCKKVYDSLIHPGIKSILENYLKDWQNIESIITQMVMRHKEIFKSKWSFDVKDSDNIDNYANEVDVEGFKNIKYGWGFSDKINYLHNNGILQDSVHDLLQILNRKRNHLHYRDTVLSERTRLEFSHGYSIVHSIYIPMSTSMEPDLAERFRNGAEQHAKNILSVIEKDQI